MASKCNYSIYPKFRISTKFKAGFLEAFYMFLQASEIRGV